METYGYAGPEMLSRGVPIIVSSKGAMVEYVEEGINGFVFDPDKKGDLALIIEELSTNEELRQKILETTLGSASKFEKFEDHARAVRRLYAGITQGSISADIT